jgi:hypothetical protein
MAHQTTCTLTAVLAFTLLSQTLAQAQDQPTTVDLPTSSSTTQRWDYASLLAPSGRKILLITIAQPTHRIACRVKSSTVDHIACKDPFGVTHTYKSQDIAALITPGDKDVRIWFLLGFNGASAAAAWGTLVLSATCIPCAVATAVVAFALFGTCGAFLMADGQPETLLYLAPGQTLQVKLRY